MQTLVGAQFWCVQVEILRPLLCALINGDGLLAASTSYQLICGSVNLSSMAFVLHDARHLIIEISPMCPRITGVWLMLVTWNVACWEWSLYWTIRSMALVICLVFIGVPYTL